MGRRRGGGFGQYGFETRLHENVYSSWIWNAGGDLFNAEGNKPLFDRPESIEGMQYLVDLMHRHRLGIAPEVIQKQTGANPYGTNVFGLTGKIGMVFNAIRPVFLEGGQVKQVVMEAMPKIQAALEEEVAADVRK